MHEVLALRLPVVRAWLTGRDVPDLGDVEGGSTSAEDRTEAPLARRALRWAGPDAGETRVIDPAELLPGDTIVVPSTYGGCDRFGWNPASTEPVTDVGDEA